MLLQSFLFESTKLSSEEFNRGRSFARNVSQNRETRPSSVPGPHDLVASHARGARAPWGGEMGEGRVCGQTRVCIGTLQHITVLATHIYTGL